MSYIACLHPYKNRACHHLLHIFFLPIPHYPPSLAAGAPQHPRPHYTAVVAFIHGLCLASLSNAFLCQLTALLVSVPAQLPENSVFLSSSLQPETYLYLCAYTIYVYTFKERLTKWGNTSRAAVLKLQYSSRQTQDILY